jgi:hypothetical protein
MTLEQRHLINLGKLLNNLLALEHILRLFFQNKINPLSNIEMASIYGSKIGVFVPENEITNYKQLGELIDDFNEEMKKRGIQSLIDPTLVEIRHALHHGRISHSGMAVIPHLIKFSKPKDGKARVVFNETLSREWLERQITRTHEGSETVRKCLLV